MIPRIGVICRCDNTGLGVQSKEFFDNIPCKALVFDMSGINAHGGQNFHWFPNQQIFKVQNRYEIRNNVKTKVGIAAIPEQIIIDFIKDIDILITFETPYDYNIFNICRAKGVKTILQLNYEFLEYPSKFPAPDLFAAPSMWHYNDIPAPKVFLPVPVNTKHFNLVRKEKTFVHIAGNRTVYNRNGTMCFLKSLRYVKNNITVILKSQHQFEIKDDIVIPKYINLVKDFNSSENYYDNYTGGVLVMPRKYGGLSLPCNEALAAEMPVIMTDIEPNNLWLPKEWLVPAKFIATFNCKKPVDVYEANTLDLADKVDLFCNDIFYNEAVNKARQIKETISFEALLPKYYEVFENLLR